MLPVSSTLSNLYIDFYPSIKTPLEKSKPAYLVGDSNYMSKLLALNHLKFVFDNFSFPAFSFLVRLTHIIAARDCNNATGETE